MNFEKWVYRNSPVLSFEARRADCGVGLEAHREFGSFLVHEDRPSLRSSWGSDVRLMLRVRSHPAAALLAN